MSMLTTTWLAMGMGVIAIVNASLMAWLWRFPMAPDPTGRNAHGISTAPRSWTNVHRGLGYVFVTLYVTLLTEMVPRAWEFRLATPTSVLHGSMGLLVGVLLATKIAIIRRFPGASHRLPWIGGTLAAATLVVVGLAVVPAWRLLQPLSALPPQLDQGRSVVARQCVQCHGASTIVGDREDAEKWDRLTREMQRNSERIPGKERITEDERILASRYLAWRLGEDEDGDQEDGGRRGRGRGRGGR